MSGLKSTRGQAAPAAPRERAVECYLAEVAAHLSGPARVHSGIVTELRSGLLDAVDSHRSAGLPPAQAVQAAVREFGDPGRVADGFRAEIAASHARRVAVILLVASFVSLLGINLLQLFLKKTA